MVGTGHGAKNGVLVKKAEALEILEKVNAMVVGKTGTLTEGIPKVQAIISIDKSQISEDESLKFAVSLEKQSEHPLAEAIVNEAEKRNLKLEKVENFESITGKGIVGEIDGKQIKIGNQTFADRVLFPFFWFAFIADDCERGDDIQFGFGYSKRVAFEKFEIVKYRQRPAGCPVLRPGGTFLSHVFCNGKEQ